MELINRSRVLVVEDDANIRRLIVVNLDRSGFALTEAADGAEACRRFDVDRPDLVLLDLMLPDMDGLALIRKFREIEPDVAVIILTARDQNLDIVRGLEHGADDYIVKPFNPLELVARIRTVLRRMRRDPDGPRKILKSGCITIDLDANRMFKHDRELELTPKEYQVAKSLMERPNRALSRNDLLNFVWGEDYIGDPKTVDVHIRKLREKLEDDPSRPHYIETVWGLGYRWRKEQ